MREWVKRMEYAVARSMYWIWLATMAFVGIHFAASDCSREVARNIIAGVFFLALTLFAFRNTTEPKFPG